MAERVNFLYRNPAGWKIAAKESNRKTAVPGSNFDQFRLEAIARQNDRWRSDVGREPEASKFTIIVPIRNEAESLPSFIATLMSQDIPAGVHANFLLVTNNCTDEGETIRVIEDFFDTLGIVKSVPTEDLGIENVDPDIAEYYSNVALPDSNITFSHIDTSTPGKVYAMNLGNNVALARGDEVAISFDANKFPEPDAVRMLVGTAYSELYDTDNPAGIISGKVMEESKGEENEWLFPSNIPPAGLDVKGSIMAWNPATVKKFGGIPHSTREDAALELLSIQNDMPVIVEDKAVTWGYSPEDASSRFDHLVRYHVGALQILAQFPELRDLAEEKILDLKAYPEIEKIVIEWARRRGQNVLLRNGYLRDFWHGVQMWGDHKYLDDPLNVAWEPAA